MTMQSSPATNGTIIATITTKVLNGYSATDVKQLGSAKVVRIGNEKEDVFLGDILTLAAVTTFVFPEKRSATVTEPGFRIVLSEDGRILSSSNSEIAEPDVANWLAANFTFYFSLKNEAGRNGRNMPENVFRATALPWIRILDTSGLSSDLLEIEVQIEPKQQDTSLSFAPRTPESALKMALAELGEIREVIKSLNTNVSLVAKDASAASSRADDCIATITKVQTSQQETTTQIQATSSAVGANQWRDRSHPGAE
jgi:hypothetical protein